MMLSPTKKPIPNNISEKELCLFKNHEKLKKARFYGDFHFFRDFRINVTFFQKNILESDFLAGLNTIKSMILARSGGTGMYWW